ncbi:tripartite tricarboxylate transporter TctB family protein [Stappia sp.]|uniref:tripartite tricarboxylate transporter TctB family protein n=1 Tax=Stappia sp. TaxID=1870903 RepID=UPI0032D8CB29
MKPVWNRAELIAALAFVATGVGALVIALDYPLGSITRMGPGFAPVGLSLLLIATAGVVALQARRAPESNVHFALRPFALIMGGILVWAVLVDRVGFVPATVLLVLACAYVEIGTTWRSSLLLAGGLCAAGYTIFIWGLGIPMSAFGG